MPSALHVLGEPRRREILRLVWDEERAAKEIAARFDVTFSAVSQHLRVLERAGFVSVRRDGRRRFYRARRDRLERWLPFLEQLWRGHLDELVTLAEEDERG
jgi:DNA-binding transcriptional ArsR family regulator